MTSSRPVEAFVDESQNRAKTVYVLSAVVVEPEHSHDYRKALRQLVTEKGADFIHSTELEPADLRTIEATLVRQPGIRVIASVHAPILRGLENARQQCIADLIPYLAQTHGVGRVVFDTREDLSIPKAERYPTLRPGRRPGPADYRGPGCRRTRRERGQS